MSVDQPFNIYREHLSSHNHGLALWDPKPDENLYKQPGHVSIGDVGYLDDGAFMRMFNVTLPWDDPSNKLLGRPGKYELIEPSHFSNVRDTEIREGEYYTVHVSKIDNIGADRHEDSLGQMYQCRDQHRGALLSLPHKGHRKDIIHKKVFENYIKDNVENWFRWSKEMMLPVENMEDLILVTGCTLVTSWAAAAFDGQMSVDSDPMTISLEARKSDGSGAQFFWRNIRGNVDFRNSPNVPEPLPQNQCVFIRGFRAKRIFFRIRPMRAAAEPLPDDPDDSLEDEIQVTQIPDSSKYRDPLSGVLDYIVEKCREDVSATEDMIAIAHDDDLKFIEGVETLTADAVEDFLREKNVPLLIENGAAILLDQADNEPPVSDEKLYAAHSPYPSMLRRSSTLSPGPAMSSTAQATSSTSTIQSIIDALADYTKVTGIDLSKTPFATATEHLTSPEAILELLQEREKEFKEYRDGNRGRLIGCLRPAVTVIQAFSGIPGKAASLVPFPPENALFAGIDALLAAASGVATSYDALLELFESLGNILKRLEIYTTIPPTPMLTDLIVKIMVESLSVLALALKQIKQGQFNNFTKKFLGESEIETVLQRLDRLTQDEARITVAQTLGVVHGLVGNVKIFLEDGKASTDSIRPYLVALHQTLSEINKPKREQLRLEVQHWLSPPDPSTNQNFVGKARHKGTAAWFFESRVSTEWNARGSLLWIHGKPGAGKSTLLSAIIQDIERMHTAGLATMAYYYFDFRDVKKQDRYGLLSSLISQLSAESDSCYSILSRLYSDNDCGIRKPGINALKCCLMDMLRLPGQGPIYIVVDALDECPDSPGTPSAREEVLELIEELVNLELPNVHLCVTSRPEIDIRVILDPLTDLKISLHDETGQKEDIVKYIKSVVHSDRNMKRWNEDDRQLVVVTLSDKTDGMFRWLVCQVDRLRRTFPASIRNVLNDLPKTLDETYRRNLLGIDEEKREYAQRLFRCLMVSIRPLRVEELAEILAIQFDEEALPIFNTNSRPTNAEVIMSVCSSLIAIVDRGGHQVVQFSHFSLKEYLTSERLAAAEEHLSYYHILPEPAHTTLALASLSVLLHLDDEIDRDTIAHLPLAPYAAQHWVDHAQFRSVSSHIKEVMKRLFDPTKPHFAAWVWLYDIDRYWTERMPTMHPTQPEAGPLYYASLCGFVGLAEHLIAHSPDVNSRGGSHTTALHAASVKGHLNVASLLLTYGADPDSRDHLGRAPLHRVSQGGRLVMAKSSLEIAQLLINSGADVNVTDDEGCVPLHAAAQSGYRDIAELLLGSSAGLDSRNEKKETPLNLACANGKRDMAQFLIDRGSDINSRDEDGFIPLHAASRWGHVDVARLLLDCGSNVSARDRQSYTPLLQASRHGHLDVARLLIDSGADVNAQEEDLWTPLHLASRSGHFDIAELLIDRGANIDSRNDKQETPLALASHFGHLDIARFLIEKGAAVSAPDKGGNTPFHRAAYKGHLHVTEFLLECGIDVNIRNGYGHTSLYLASMNGKLDVVRFLIDQGANVHIGDNNNSNPLHIASQKGHLDIVQLMINTGTPVDVRNGYQMTPLALASSVGKAEVVRFLIYRGADLNVRDSESQALLHLASQHGHLDMARLLLDLWLDPNVKRNDLCGPLHLASANGHLKIAELLIQRGARVNVSNDKQETPLYGAVTNGNVAIARFLIDHGATVHTADSNGWTPLHAASRRGHLGVVKLLLQWGADVDVLDKAGRSAAELASENGQAEVAEFFSEYKANPNTRNKLLSTSLDTVEYGADDDDWNDEAKVSLHAAAEEGNIDTLKSLLERGMDINARNVSNQTPLDRAAVKGNVDVVRLLIERGAEVDSRDKRGWTPLHKSSRYGHLEVSRVLLDHGANVNARNQDYRTPMHLSARNGYLEIVKLLLERGADIHAINAEGETPYQVSVQSGYREIADLLRNHGAGRLGESP